MPPRDVQSALAERPQIARELAAHVRTIVESGTVDARTKHLCAAMVAAVNFCDPLLIEHRRAARHAGAATEKLNDLWDFAKSDRFGGDERAALSAAVALSREPRALPPAIWRELRAHYDGGGISEILCTIGVMNYVARLYNALDSEICG